MEKKKMKKRFLQNTKEAKKFKLFYKIKILLLEYVFYLFCFSDY